MPSLSSTTEIAEALKAIAHPLRLEVLMLLNEHQSMSVNELLGKLSVAVDQPLLSHHLLKMKHAGILTCKRDGIYANYSLTDPNVIGIVKCMKNCSLKTA